MASFDKEKFNNGFNLKKFQLEKNQAAEMRSLIDINRSSGTLDSTSFYDQRIEMKKRHFKDIIELTINSLIGSIPFKAKIDEEDGKAFEEILKEISSAYVEREKSTFKVAMVSYGHTLDSQFVAESLKTFEKQLIAVKTGLLDNLQIKITDHNNIKSNRIGDVEKGQKWKKYTALIIIGLIIVIICIAVLYFIL
jgi:hypothetical protein